MLPAFSPADGVTARRAQVTQVSSHENQQEAGGLAACSAGRTRRAHIERPAPAPPADQAAAARANAEQNQPLQRREARTRAAAIQAPAVRSTVPKIDAYPALARESPCFRVDTLALEVPAALSPSAALQGALALPLDPLAFARVARALRGPMYRQGRHRHARERIAAGDSEPGLCDHAFRTVRLIASTWPCPTRICRCRPSSRRRRSAT